MEPESLPAVAVLLACFNRRDSTLRCLSTLNQQEVNARVRIVVLDDGSTDGTGDAIRDQFPAVDVVTSTGNLYWAASMARAEAVAMEARPDLLIWMNDDVVLDDGALQRLLAASYENPDSIVGGAMRDPDTAVVTYTGYRRVDRHPLHLRAVQPDNGVATEVDALNGNFVAVPASVQERVGKIDGAFAHAYADFDYSFRTSQAGFKVLLAPGTFGTCPRNPTTGARSRREALRRLRAPKGSPLRSQVRFLRRHGGWEWPIYLAGPYVKALMKPAAGTESI